MRLSWLFLLVVLLQSSVQAQIIIKGKILNSDGLTINNATVAYKQVDGTILLGFTKSGDDGNFNLKINVSDVDSIWLDISHLSYEKKIITVANQAQEHEIVLFPSSNQIEEVWLSEVRMFKRHDTLNYSVNSFRSAEDRVIADVIQKGYRDDILQRISNSNEGIGNNISSPLIRQFFQMGMEKVDKNAKLFNYYKSIYWSYTKGDLPMDPLLIPERELSYYSGIITAHYADTTHLLGVNYNLFHNIRKELLPLLPPIVETGFLTYQKRLDSLFGSIFPQGRNNLFFDMMLAGAYIDQLNQEQPLSINQRHEVGYYFENKYLSNYILYQDDMSVQKRGIESSASNAFHLPFEKDKTEVLSDILDKYKGKVVVMDFWATWCGPCLEAHELIKPVKSHFKDHEDVVFVYLTNESSDYTRWKDYASILGGEHYYLHNAQQDEIVSLYNILSIPSYLIFDKNGQLTFSSLGEYMGNDTLIKWIEETNDI